jgi:hypothetical protein
MPQVTDLDSYRRQRQAGPGDTPAYIEREPDPECPCRTLYLIISRRSDKVQAAISTLIDEVEDSGNGRAIFSGPHRFNGLYYATGAVVLF